MFDKESVKLDHLPKKNKLEDSYETHPATARIQPPAGSPTLWSELELKQKKNFVITLNYELVITKLLFLFLKGRR